MKLNLKKISYCLYTASFFLSHLSANNPNFYKAPNLYSRSTSCRFDNEEHYNVKTGYTKLDITYSYGSTRSAWKHSGGSTSLLNTTGNQNMLYLFENVKKLPSIDDFTTFLGAAQINHSKTNNTFGQLEFGGKFTVHDLEINLRQNLTSGFFAELIVPLKKVEVKNIHYIDKSPEAGLFSQNTWEWKQFKNNLNAILNNFGLRDYNTPYSASDMGDLNAIIGWHDFLTQDKDNDVQTSLELKAGVICPTGHDGDSSWIFDPSTGHNNHWGINFLGELSLTYKDWLTFNLHASTNFFFDKTKTKNMKTFNKQNGPIKLGQGNAKEEKGLFWHVGLDAKADHFIEGLSAWIGYSYNRQEADFLWPEDTFYFNSTTVNNDTALAASYVNVLHLMLDYDFSVHMQNSIWAPLLSAFYNYPFSGRNIFKTATIGAGLGFDIRWNF